jgi:hypothetical protein
MSALRKLAAAAAVLASVHSAEAMTFLTDPSDKNGQNGGNLYVYAKGTIEIGDAQRFRLFLAALPPWKGDLILTLTSPGGSVTEAMAIAAIVDKRHFVTNAMGDECASACVLAWAAGAQRFVKAKTCIGVHNATVTGVAKKSVAAAEDRWTLSMMTWVAAHGAPHNVLTQMLATSGSAMYCLTDADLAAWNVTVLPE